MMQYNIVIYLISVLARKLGPRNGGKYTRVQCIRLRAANTVRVDCVLENDLIFFGGFFFSLAKSCYSFDVRLRSRRCKGARASGGACRRHARAAVYNILLYR